MHWWLKRFLIGFGLLGILFMGQCAKRVALWIVYVNVNMDWFFFGLLFGGLVVLGLFFVGLRFQ